MDDLLKQMAQGLDKPTEGNLQEAREQMALREGEKLNQNGLSVYISKQPVVYETQIRCWAFGIVAGKKATLAPTSSVEPKTEAQIEAELLETSIEREKRISSLMMGRESIYANISASNPLTKQTAVLKFLLEEFHYSGKNNVLLLGGVGSGKTYGSIAYVSCIADFTQYGCNAEFIYAYRLSELIQRKEWNTLDQLRKSKILLIDDLGTEGSGYKGNDFVSFFENLFTERHEKKKKTIINSNSTMEQIKQAYGDRFISRFRESGLIYQTPDSDMRGKS